MLANPVDTVIIPELAEMYNSGLSLRDIAKKTGYSKSAIRHKLGLMGVRLRPRLPKKYSSKSIFSRKTNITPYYGFCYFQGKMVKNPAEYDGLKLIYDLWIKDTNPNRIAEILNQKKIKPRIAKQWNRNSVISSITRFKDKKILLKGGELELG